MDLDKNPRSVIQERGMRSVEPALWNKWVPWVMSVAGGVVAGGIGVAVPGEGGDLVSAWVFVAVCALLVGIYLTKFVLVLRAQMPNDKWRRFTDDYLGTPGPAAGAIWLCLMTILHVGYSVWQTEHGVDDPSTTIVVLGSVTASLLVMTIFVFAVSWKILKEDSLEA